MKEQVLNEIVKFDSTAEYYQQLEKSILGKKCCCTQDRSLIMAIR